MKILIISDTIEIKTILNEIDSQNYFNSIQIDLFVLSKSKLSDLTSLIASTKYNLVLAVTKAIYQSQYFSDIEVANSINNYSIADDFRLINVVNKTTNYFNVMLPISKAVSVSDTVKVEDNQLKRIDLISTYNFEIANILDRYHCQYYILNYSSDFPNTFVEQILQKIE